MLNEIKENEIPKGPENKTKLLEKSKKCTFIGYEVNDFTYRLYDYKNHKIIRSRVVVFNEKAMCKD